MNKSAVKEMRHSTLEEQAAYENMLNKYSFPITENFNIMDLDITEEGVMKIIKPTIIAICGKSCTGKSTLANFLNNYFNIHCGVAVKKILSDTTRPRRIGEENGLDYNFISKKEFDSRYEDGQYICVTQFRKWLYAIRRKQLVSDNVYIGVFDTKGIKDLVKGHYHPVIVYLDEPLDVRLKRSKKREGKWKTEFFKRAFRDFCNFLHFKKKYKKYSYFLDLSEISNTARRAGQIKRFLDDKKVRLGKKA